MKYILILLVSLIMLSGCSTVTEPKLENINGWLFYGWQIDEITARIITIDESHTYEDYKYGAPQPMLKVDTTFYTLNAYNNTVRQDLIDARNQGICVWYTEITDTSITVDCFKKDE